VLPALTETRRQLAAAVDARLNTIAALPPPPVFLGVQRALAVSVPMQSATCTSLLVHLLLIIGVGFVGIDPKAFEPPHNVLDVILVNSKSKQRPSKALALAQANLDGGGNTEQKLRASTPLPALNQQASKNEVRAQQEHVRQLEQEIKVLMTRTKAQAKVTPNEAAQPSGSPNPLSANELLQRSLEIERLEAEIAQQHKAYQERPKRTFLGASASEYRFAVYVDQWRQRVERVGNLNYPEEAKRKSIHGRLQLTVAIKANGEIEKVEINRSSGSKILDDAAKRIVFLAAPFERFPSNVARDTDILHITRTWIFAKGDEIVTE
jgi:protein TonB